MVLVFSSFDLKDTNTCTISSFKIISFENQRTFFFDSLPLSVPNLLYLSFPSSFLEVPSQSSEQSHSSPDLCNYVFSAHDSQSSTTIHKLKDNSLSNFYILGIGNTVKTRTLNFKVETDIFFIEG